MGRPITDEEVLNCFSEVQIPVECWFLLDNLVYTWDPVNAYFASQIIEDDDLYLGCKAYLRQRGMVFPSLQAVQQYAAERGWPSYHLMPKNRPVD
jgi:hypothetical protein